MNAKDKFLTQKNYGPDYGKWSSVDSFREPMARFVLEHGRLPTSYEFDDCPYLPTSRWVQMNFGGLKSLKKELGYTDLSYGVGEHRSKIALEGNTKGRTTEDNVMTILIEKFGEMFVHDQRRYGDTGNRLDFYVYSPSGNFGIDVFSTSDIRTLRIVVNNKVTKYRYFPSDNKLFLVCGNNEISQDLITKFCNARLNNINGNIFVVNARSFIKLVSDMRKYRPVSS